MTQRQLKKIIRGSTLTLFLLIAFIFGQGKVHQREGLRISFPFGKKYDYNNILVRKVVDGDTIELENGERIRLIGIDTPEMYESDKLFRDVQRTGQDIKTIQNMGREAYEFTKQLCEGKRVRLEFDLEKRDKYDRLLAYVFIPVCGTNWLQVSDGVVKKHIAKDDGSLHVEDSFDVECFKGLYAVNLSGYIIQYGYAQPMIIPPNLKYAELFRKLYQEAKENRRGLWK